MCGLRMSALGNQRGDSKFGCVAMLLLMALLVFLAVKIVPVYVDKISFGDDVTRIVNRAGANNWGDQAIREQIIKTARSLDFDLRQGQIKIERSGRFQSASRLKVTVTYSRDVSFPGYTHSFSFESEFEALVGRL